jgi:hypothetical protein
MQRVKALDLCGVQKRAKQPLLLFEDHEVASAPAGIPGAACGDSHRGAWWFRDRRSRLAVQRVAFVDRELDSLLGI